MPKLVVHMLFLSYVFEYQHYFENKVESRVSFIFLNKTNFKPSTYLKIFYKLVIC